MPTPAHRRLSFEGVFGTLLAPVEEWSFRLNLAPDVSPDDPQTLLNASQTAFTTHLAPRLRPTARLTRIKLADITAAGLYAGDPAVKDVDVPGTATTSNHMPLSVALAISLTTPRRGATGRGRIFMPAPSVGTINATDGTMEATFAQAWATAAASFLGAINGPAGFGNVVVASSKGYLTNVTGVRVGRVPDVIRSRRTKVPESYGAIVTVTA